MRGAYGLFDLLNLSIQYAAASGPGYDVFICTNFGEATPDGVTVDA